MSIHEALPFHEGEINIHKTLHIDPDGNPTTPFLSPFASHVLQRAPLVALGTVDSDGRPWTSLWGGEPAFARQIARGLGAEEDLDDVVQGGENGPLMSGLAIDLDSRLRVKLAGKMVAGALQEPKKGSGVAEVQLVMKIERSLGTHPSLPPRKHLK